MGPAAWGLLLLAIALEVVGTTALKAAEGFTRAGPSAITVICYGGAFWLLSLAMKTMPVGVVYVIWSGLGIVLISLVAVVWYGQRLDWAAIIGLGLIVAGVLVVQVFSKSVQ